jgi:hypothetical protein
MDDNARPHRSRAVTTYLQSEAVTSLPCDDLKPCVSSLQIDVGCPVVIAAVIPDAMLLPTDECFAQK